MWKIGTELCLKEKQNSWALQSHTLIKIYSETNWTYCKRKGGTEDVYPFHTNELERVSNNPFIRIKRLFKRAFEC